MTGRPASFRLYRLLTGLAEPFAPSLLRRRARRGKEDRTRLPERLGIASLPRPEGRLVWIHAASVGESLSHLPLVERFVRDRPDLHILVTSGTRTSAELLARTEAAAPSSPRSSAAAQVGRKHPSATPWRQCGRRCAPDPRPCPAPALAVRLGS